MNPEAISEVKVLTAGYQAEYGRSSGLQITAVTKSGTNKFRGSVYDVMRDSDWNSNSWVNKINGTPKAVDKQSDWGYTIGGPVGRPGATNKLFFFYAHEYRPRNAANTLRQFRVPTQAERNGDFSASLDNNGAPIPTLRDAVGAGITGQRIPQEKLYQTGMNLLKLYPLPSMTQAPGTSYNLEFKLGGARTAQFRLEMFNAFNALVYNARQTQLQLVSPANQTIRNPQFLADGTVDPNRLKTTAAGFGAATGAQPLRTIQAQLRFSL